MLVTHYTAAYINLKLNARENEAFFGNQSVTGTSARSAIL
jgi:hypothetical protein